MSHKRFSISRVMTASLTMAMIAILLFQLPLIFRMLHDQRQADAEYFQMQIESISDSIIAQQKELQGIAAQLLEMSATHTFLQDDPDILRRYRASVQLDEAIALILRYNKQLLSIHFLTDGGDCWSFLSSTDLGTQRDFKRIRDRLRASGDSARFMLYTPGDSRENSRFLYVVPFAIQGSGSGNACLFIMGNTGTYASLLQSEYVDMRLVDMYGNEYPNIGKAGDQGGFATPLLLGSSLVGRQRDVYVDISIKSYIVQTLGMMGLMAIILTVAVLLIRATVTQPISHLRRQLREAYEGSLHRVTPSGNGCEIYELAEYVNHLICALEQRSEDNLNAQDRLYRLELTRREMQFYALRNQINPHFLNNALQAIRGMALCAGARNIATVATNLSEMFRYTIQEKNMATIAEEMAIAEKYMQVMNARYDQRFHYSSRTEEGLEEVRIPRMVIQPLLENAILHGFSGSLDHGTVDVECRKTDSVIRISVEDTGVGFSPESLDKIRQRMNEAFSLDTRIRDDSLGLRNIHQRIATLYGPAYGVSIESRPGFTRVWLTIPSLDEENVF